MRLSIRLPANKILCVPACTIALVASLGCAAGEVSNNEGSAAMTEPSTISGGSGSETGTASGGSSMETTTSGPSTTDTTNGSATATTATTATTSTTAPTTTETTGPEPCAIDLSWDFASCPSQWTHGEAHPSSVPSSWQCGDPTAFSQGPGTDHTGVWATNLVGNYADGESSFLQSPPISLVDCADKAVVLAFEHWYGFEGGASNADGGIVQVSTDGGFSWTTVVPFDEGYHEGVPLSTSWDPPDGQAGFSALSANKTWRTSQVDLGDYAGEADVAVRFVFGSDAANPRGGWYIDSVAISGG